MYVWDMPQRVWGLEESRGEGEAVTKLTHLKTLNTGALWSKPGAAEFHFLGFGLEIPEKRDLFTAEAQGLQPTPDGERIIH